MSGNARLRSALAGPSGGPKTPSLQGFLDAGVPARACLEARTLWLLAGFMLALLAGCGSTAPPEVPDASACTVSVALGTGSSASFTPLADGEVVHPVLGSQGLVMMWISLEVVGYVPPNVEITWRTAVPDTGVDVEQYDRYAPLVLTGANTGVVESWILFFEGALAPSLFDHDADIDVVVHAGDCVGTAHVRVALRAE